MRIARGVILLLIAPALAAGQSIGPPAPPWDAPAQATGIADRPEVASAPAAAPADPENRPLGPANSAGEAAPLGAPTSPARLGIGRTIISLAVVVGLAALLAAAYRQWAVSRGGLALAMGAGGRAPSGVLEVLARYPISRGLTLVLLKIDRRVLLLAQSRTGRLGAGTSLRALCEVTDPEEVAALVGRCRDEAGESLAGRFRSMLTQFEATDEELAEIDGEEPLRLVQFSTDGDRVELWDTRDGDAADPWDEQDPYARAGGAVG